MRIIFLLLLFLPQLAKAEWYSKEKLQRKIKEAPPEWMMSQIHNDLSFFAESGITEETFSRTYNVYNVPIGNVAARLQHFAIRNNEAVTSEGWRYWRVDIILDFLNELAKNVILPDVDFLFCLSDLYDNPSFLEATECPVLTIAKYWGNTKAALAPDVTWPVLQNRQGNVNDIRWTSVNRPWEQRNDIAFWRGTMTDIDKIHFSGEWDCSQRPRLIFFSLQHPDLVNARYTYPLATIEDGLIDYLFQLGMIADRYEFRYWTNFRYLIAVDGVSYPSAFHGELFSGSTVLKQDSEFIEWFYNAIQPHVHYVPFRKDCSDLEEKVLWLKSHQEEAKKIAQNAFDFAEENLQAEDIMLYYYLLLVEYAKLWRK